MYCIIFGIRAWFSIGSIPVRVLRLRSRLSFLKVYYFSGFLFLSLHPFKYFICFFWCDSQPSLSPSSFSPSSSSSVASSPYYSTFLHSILTLFLFSIIALPIYLSLKPDFLYSLSVFVFYHLLHPFFQVCFSYEGSSYSSTPCDSLEKPSKLIMFLIFLNGGDFVLILVAVYEESLTHGTLLIGENFRFGEGKSCTTGGPPFIAN